MHYLLRLTLSLIALATGAALLWHGITLPATETGAEWLASMTGWLATTTTAIALSPIKPGI
jgi:hypothetical protein